MQWSLVILILCAIIPTGFISGQLTVPTSPQQVQIGLKKLMSAEVQALHFYIALGQYFATVSLNGYSTLFFTTGLNHIYQVFKLIDYQRLRGNDVAFPLDKTSWVNGLDALTDALFIENCIYDQAESALTAARVNLDETTVEYLQTNEQATETELKTKLGGLYLTRNRAGISNSSEYFFDYDMIHNTDPPFDNSGQFSGQTGLFVSW